MANFSPASSSNPGHPANVKNDLNGNSEPAGDHRDEPNGVQGSLTIVAHGGLTHGVQRSLTHGSQIGLTNGSQIGLTNGSQGGISNGSQLPLTNGSQGGLANGSSFESHGGARPKIRRPVELNGPSRPSTSGRTFNDSDQKVPVKVFHHVQSPEGDSDLEDSTNQDSDTNDDLYVYTYKGFEEVSSRDEYEADLPKSFFQLDVGSDSESGAANQADLGPGPGQSNLSNEVAAALIIQSEMSSNRKRRVQQPRPPSGRDSPDMDFLEMDFDPGESDDDQPGQPLQQQQQLEDQPTEEPAQEENELEVDGAIGLDPEFVSELFLPHCQVDGFDGMTSAPLQSPSEPSGSMVRSRSLNYPMTNKLPLYARLEPTMVRGESDPGNSARNKRRHSGEALCEQSSSSSSGGNASCIFSDPFVDMEVCRARLSLRETIFCTSSSSSCMKRSITKLRMIDKRSIQTQTSPDNSFQENLPFEDMVEKTMIWTESEACNIHVNQVGASACGATAVINVLQALEYPHTIEQVVAVVPTRLRSEKENIPKYLFSRSVAGTTHRDLIQAVEQMSEGKIYARFFHMYPLRKFHLTSWLRDWILLGAVPMATLNLQRGPVLPGQTIPDAWHHQMIFGVHLHSVYLTNPLENVCSSIMSKQLSSPSELLVRRRDVMSRVARTNGLVDPDCDLTPLCHHPDERWDHYNVLGQVVNLFREEQAARRSTLPPGMATQTSHIRIPAAYQSGITLFVPVSNEQCYQKLMLAPELPLLVADVESASDTLKDVEDQRIQKQRKEKNKSPPKTEET